MEQAKRKELTRLSLQQAAILLFSQKSFDQVTVDAIAQNARCSKRTLYMYYPSKMALISSIFEERLQELYTTQVRSFVTCTTGLDVIICSFKNLCQFTEKNLDFMKMFWFVKDKHPVNMPDELLERINGWNRMILDLTATAIKQKELTGPWAERSPYLIAHYISALNKGIFIHQNKESDLNVMDVDTQALIDFSISNIIYCAKPPEG